MNNITDLIRTIRGGVFANDVSDQLKALVDRCQESGKKGKLTIELTFEPSGAGNRIMNVHPKAKTVLPPRPDTTEPGIFYAVRGELVRDDPDQKKLPLDELESRRESERSSNPLGMGLGTTRAG